MFVENIFTVKVPDLDVMGFVSNTEFAGSYTENSYNYKNFKIKLIGYFCNEMQVPRFGYQPNYSMKI